MGARNVTKRIDYDGDHHAGDEPGANHPKPAAHQAVNHHRAGGEKDQAKGADELAAIFLPVVSCHKERIRRTSSGEAVLSPSVSITSTAFSTKAALDGARTPRER